MLCNTLCLFAQCLHRLTLARRFCDWQRLAFETLVFLLQLL